MRPKISICIPTYNQKPEYLRECVQSALQQRYDPLEVVVSENHSTNDAPVVLSDFEDTRLRVVKPPLHVSAVQNFAFCATQSTGEYLNFLSSDDLIHPDFSCRMAEILDAHPNLAFAHSAVARINEESKVVGYERSIHPSFLRSGVEELQRYVWGQRNVIIAALMRRTAYESAGGWKGYDMVADWDLSIRLLSVGAVAYCSNVMAYYRDWSTPDRRRRFLPRVRDVRLLYERLESSGLVAQIDGGIGTLNKARRSNAIHMAESLPSSDLSPGELVEAVRGIKLLNDSFSVRARLSLVQAGLGPLFLARKRVREWLRQRVKSFLYPRSSGELVRSREQQ